MHAHSTHRLFFLAIFGIFLCGLSLLGVGWNEKRAACISQRLHTGLHHVHHVEDCSDVEVANNLDADDDERKLVHISCKLHDDLSQPKVTPAAFESATDVGLDDAFEVRAYKVIQEVSMYQCMETQIANSVSDYKADWSPTPIDSSKFKALSNQDAKIRNACSRSNPAFPANPGQAIKHGDLLVIGNWGLSPGTGLPRLGGGFMMQRFADRIQADEVIMPRTNLSLRIGGEAAFVNGDGSVTSCDVSGPRAPEVGCLRVSWRRSTTESLSVMARLVKRRLRDLPDYVPEHGHEDDHVIRTEPWHVPGSLLCPEGTVDLFEQGEWDAKAMVNLALGKHGVEFWGARMIGLLLAVLGFGLVLLPMRDLASFNAIWPATFFSEFLDDLKASPGGELTDFKAVVGFALILGAGSTTLVMVAMRSVIQPSFGCPLLVGLMVLLRYTWRGIRADQEKGRAERLGKRGIEAEGADPAKKGD